MVYYKPKGFISLGQVIEAYMISRGITKGELAEVTGLSTHQIDRILTNEDTGMSKILETIMFELNLCITEAPESEEEENESFDGESDE